MLASFLLAAALVTTGIATPLQSDQLSDEVNDIDVKDEQVNNEWVSEDFLEAVDTSDGYLEADDTSDGYLKEDDSSDGYLEEGDSSDGYFQEMPAAEKLESYASNNQLRAACTRMLYRVWWSYFAFLCCSGMLCL